MNTNSCKLQPQRHDAILRHLQRIKPIDAFYIPGLTFIDLCSCDTWNYEFGKSANKLGVGVRSFSRLVGRLSVESSTMTAQAELVMAGAGGRHDKQAWPVQPHTLTATELQQCCKVTSHEGCHLDWLRCVMQGVSSPEESLLRSMNLCPICTTRWASACSRYTENSRDAVIMLLSLGLREKGPGSFLQGPDGCLFSSDTKVACEGTSQPASGTLEPSSPAVSVSHVRLHGGGSGTVTPLPPAVPVRTQGLAATSMVEVFADLLGDYEAWLDSCVRALQAEVPEGELSQLDRMVDAMKAPTINPARVPSPLRVSLELPREEWSLRRVIGQKFDQLLRKLRLRQLRTDHSHGDSED